MSATMMSFVPSVPATTTPATSGCMIKLTHQTRPVPVLRDQLPYHDTRIQSLVAPLRRVVQGCGPLRARERFIPSVDLLLRKADVLFEEGAMHAGYSGYANPTNEAARCVREAIEELLAQGVSGSEGVDLVEHAFRHAGPGTLAVVEDYMMRGAQRYSLRGRIYDSPDSRKTAPFLAVDLRDMPVGARMGLRLSMHGRPKVEQSHLVLDEQERQHFVIDGDGYHTVFHCYYDPEQQIFELRVVGYYSYNYTSSSVMINGVSFFSGENNSDSLTPPVRFSTKGMERVIVDLGQYGRSPNVKGGIAFLLGQ